MEERLIAFVIWAIMGVLFIAMGIYDLNSKKAKVLSVHPQDSYALEAGEDGMLSLTVKDENSFWKQTKYLVVMIN